MSDPLMALCLFALYCHWQRPTHFGHACAAGVWAGLALLSRKQSEAIVPVLICFLLFSQTSRHERCRWLSFLLGASPFLVVHLAYNHARWGDFFLERYAGVPPFRVPTAWHWAERIAFLLVGPDTGFFVFNPILALLWLGGAWAWQKARFEELCLVVGLLVTQVFFLALFPFWRGGICFGSRFLLFMVPFVALSWAYWGPGFRGWKHLLLVGGACLGLWIQFIGVATDPLAVWWRRQLYLAPGAWIIHAGWDECLRGAGLDRVQPARRDTIAMRYWTHPAFKVPDLWLCHICQLRSLAGRDTKDRP